MEIDPAIVVGIILTIVVSAFTFFLTRMVRQNDKTNDKQDGDIKTLSDKMSEMDTQVKLNTQADELKIGPIQNEIKGLGRRMDGFEKEFKEHMDKHVGIKAYVDKELNKLRDELKG